MKSARWLFLLLPVVTIPAAEARSFGEPFPVTNTRYRAAYGEPQLATNDRDFFLFWSAEEKIRAARVDEGEPRVSHVVLDTDEPFDVAWTGDRYLVVSTRTAPGYPYEAAVVGRFLDAEAHPIGPEFTMAPDGNRPRIAVGANSIAIVYGVGFEETRLVLLSRNARTIETPSRVIAPRGTTHDVTRIGDRFLAIVATTSGVRAMTFDEQGQQIAQSTLTAPNDYREVALASDGTNALALWSEEYTVIAATVDENANFGAQLVLDQSARNGSPTAIWNGGGWTVSYTRQSNAISARAQVVQLDWRAQTILSREESAVGHRSPTIAALDGRVLASWLPVAGRNRSPVVAGLPLASNEPRRVPYTASSQTLLATASSADATLTVWSESVDGGASIHAGVRKHDGDWREVELASGSGPAIRAMAASDGQEFAVALADTTSSLIRLDATGRRLGAAVALPLTPLVMAWNGTNYALIDSFRGVLVSPAGVVSAPVLIGHGLYPSALASDGSGFFLAGEVYDCPFILCYTIAIGGVRLGADLKRIDTQDLSFSDDDQPSFAGAVWNGSTYVMLWQDAEWYLTHIPASPNSGIETKRIHPVDINPETMAVLSDGTIAVAGRDPSVEGGMSRVAFLSAEGEVLEMSGIERSANVLEKPRLEPVPGGVAYIASSVQDSAPHDGTSRVVTAIAKSASGPLPPGVPHVGVKLQNGNIVIDWSAPSGTVNGYRLEYRVDDDSWNEYEQWFGPGVQRKSIRKPSFGTQFSFRVRAFNDGGASDYSGTAVTSPGRRRAVR